VRVFKNTWFTRFAGKEGITDSELKETVNRLEAGQTSPHGGGDADLGGGGGERTFYVYGFAKSDRANISGKELKAYKGAAKEYFCMTSDQIRERIEYGQLVEL
jgi:hypothetical protein